MIEQHYYFEDPKYEELLNKKYYTLWHGYLKGSKEKWFQEKDYSSSSDIITDACDINFYRHYTEDHLYLSLDSDERYFYYQFEKNIFKMIKDLEKNFDVFIEEAEFYANEIRHNGDQIRYTISRKKDNSHKILLKKKVLNWKSFDAKVNKETK